jgi:hypothetical protein
MPSINNLSPYANISTAISPIDTSIIQFSDKDSKTILSITPEGQIEIGEGYTPTEAGDEFIDRLSMYLPNALEQKFKHEIDLSMLPFDYFNWIAIQKENGQNLLINTQIVLLVGEIKVLEYTINTETIFDEENYYKFNIDFSNNILYKYHTINLLIKKPYQDEQNTIYNMLQPIYNKNIKYHQIVLISTSQTR